MSHVVRYKKRGLSNSESDNWIVVILIIVVHVAIVHIVIDCIVRTILGTRPTVEQRKQKCL